MEDGEPPEQLDGDGGGVLLVLDPDDSALLAGRELELVENSKVNSEPQQAERRTRLVKTGTDSDQDLNSAEPKLAEADLPVLPEIIVREILKQLSDLQSLLNSRLVCTLWNQIIENTSELMRKITFTISNLKEFLNLSIVQKRKVKSIRFNTSTLELESEESAVNEELELFLQAISTVEKVSFEFEEIPGTPITVIDDAKLCNLVLKNCNRLQELKFNCYSNSNSFLPKFTSVFGNLLVDEFPSTNKAKKISVNVEGFKDGPATDLVKFLLKLPKLEVIDLYGTCWNSEAYTTILHGLCEYIRTYKRNICLKELSLDIRKNLTGTSNDEAFVLLLILAGKFGIKLTKVPTIELNSVLTFTSSPEDQELPWNFLQCQRPLFPAKINGKLTFEDTTEQLTNLTRLCGLNFGDLHLIFERPNIFQGELSYWMHQIQSLDCLILQNCMFSFQLSPISFRELQTAFLNQTCVLLKVLKLLNDIFDHLFGTFPLLTNFPNLKELYFENCKVTPNDFIFQLSSLELLETLVLNDMPALVDLTFTKEFVEGKPAISCFKRLNVLRLLHCILLTNVCVINGISKCKTLKKLEIRNCRKITMECVVENMTGFCEVEFSDV